MDAYSILLAVALFLASSSLAAGLGSRVRGSRRWGRLGQFSACLGLVFGVASALVHWFAGHRPGTASAMSLSGFAGEHPALLVVAGLSVLAMWLSSSG